MSVTINGNGTISGYTPATISGTLSGSNMPAGSIIQTVVGTSDDQNASSVHVTSTNSSAPTFFHSACKVTITPQFSNSKILIMWTGGIRLDPDAEGYVGADYSPNSDMSSPVIIDPKRGADLGESFRNNDGASDAHIFWVQTQTTWDSTVSNTNTRYYNVGAYLSNNDTIEYGDGQVGLTIMAQEIKS